MNIDWEKMRAAIDYAQEHQFEGAVSIAPGKSPGGIVFQVWIDGEMAIERCFSRADKKITATGKEDGERSRLALEEGRGVELRVFDGDTGFCIYPRALGTTL